MGYFLGVLLLFIALAAANNSQTDTSIKALSESLSYGAPSYRVYTPPKGHYDRRITGYKLKRNIVYDLIKEPSKYGYSKGYTDREMHLMGFQEYTIESQYGWVWVPPR